MGKFEGFKIVSSRHYFYCCCCCYCCCRHRRHYYCWQSCCKWTSPPGIPTFVASPARPGPTWTCQPQGTKAEAPLPLLLQPEDESRGLSGEGGPQWWGEGKGLGALAGCQAWASEVGELSSGHWSTRDLPAPHNIIQRELSQRSLSQR